MSSSPRNATQLTATAALWNLVVCGALMGAGAVLCYRAVAGLAADRLDADVALACAAAGVALVFTGIHGRHIHRLRVSSASTLEALHDLLYGKDHRKDREAIGILIRSLASPDAAVATSAHAHLQRLTGQAFAADPAVWQSWWTAHERTWSRATAREHDAETT